MNREMLIHVGEETAIALVEDGQLREIFLPQSDQQHLLGNIYLGQVENVLPGMQAAFVDIGLEKNSFLYVDDAISARRAADAAPVGIGELVKKGQQIVVQVFKEPTGTKGARVTMQPSLPGRYLVLLPLGEYIAVSRRIESEAERERLRELLREQLPEHMGAIIRTVAEHAGPEVLAADLKMLLKEWRRIQGRAAKASPPALLHNDCDLLMRIIRDTNPADVDSILTADTETYDKMSDIIAAIAPALVPKLKLKECRGLFWEYEIFSQMERALRRKVWLKSGGYIIIDQMEALTAVDVNTGKYVGESNLGDTVLKTNMEAVTEIARQLRLRNIGGIVIIDFIDMEQAADKQRLLSALEEEVKQDRVRVTVMGMTELGLVELTRKKIGHDLSTFIEKECPHCGGKGKIPSPPML